MSQIELLNRILNILNQKIAMGQGEGGRMRRKRLGGVLFADGGVSAGKRKCKASGVMAGECCSSDDEIDEYDGGVMAGKRRKQKKTKKTGMGVMAGKRKKGGSNGWISHVKAYQNKHGCSYTDALKKAGASYKK